MAVAKRKVKRFVVDVNSFITIFLNKEHEWFLSYVEQNNLEIFIDDLLIEELKKVLDYDKVKKLLPLSRQFYINFVYKIAIYVNVESFNIKSPDPNDNFLYDIALTTNAKLLVTGEKALLNWKNSPVEAINLSTFKQLF